MIASAEAPKRIRIGRAKREPTAIRIIAQTQSIVKEVFIMRLAVSGSFFPRKIEKSGAPPVPKRLLKAVMMTMIGKHKPTAPRAAVPISGIRAM